MAQKHTWPRQKVTLKITQAQVDLILEKDPYGQKIHLSQFPDHRSQPRVTQFNPAWAAAAPGQHDPSTLLCLPSSPTQHPNTAHSIPPHTSQALEHPTAQQPNTHGPASSKLTFELVKCTGPGTPSVSGLLTPSFP